VIERVNALTRGCGILGISAHTEPATIIRAMRAGCGQFVSKPIDTQDLQGAVERIRASLQVASHASKRVCVVGSSGGSGATTIACNLAMELAHLTDQCSGLVDLDLEYGDVACAFDCSPKYSVADVCCEGVEVDRFLLDQAVNALPCRVSILARPEELARSRQVTPEGVHRMLRVMADMFPHVVVDLPRSFSNLSSAAVNEADCILIVTQLSVPCIRNATRLYQCLAQMGADEERIEIVLNRSNANFERITADEVASHFGRTVFALIPNDYRRVQTSVDLGHPVMADSPNSPARLAIREMARMIANQQIGDKKIQPASSGLLGKFWKRTAGAGV
jgi:pilus assembly protein CpaE